MQPLPVGETGGVAEDKGEWPVGYHPACTERSEGRLGKPARRASAFTLDRREGLAP